MCSYTTLTFITEVPHHVIRIQTLNHPFSETNDFYNGSITLLGWFTSWCASLPRSWLLIKLFHYVLKHSKLAQLAIYIQYHMNAIYNLRGGHTHIPTSQTKAILRYEVRTWFKMISCIPFIVIHNELKPYKSYYIIRTLEFTYAINV